MNKKLSLTLGLLGALALATGCGKSTTTTDGGTKKGDGGVTLFDGTSGTADTGGGGHDMGAPLADQGTGPQKGFGDTCTADNTKKCETGFSCVFMEQGAAKGFCTKTCTNSGQQCPGSPANTFAGCVLQVQTQGGGTQNACAFICEHPQAGKYTCPGEMVCAAEDNPKGSGQKACLPPK